MVQYYRPIILGAAGEKEVIRSWVNPQEYGQSPALMDHSDKDSKFVSAVEMLLARGRSRLVWAGDYVAAEPGSKLNLYKMCEEAQQIFPEESDMSYYGYIVNHTKRQFVWKDRTEKYTNLHALPFLTAESGGYTAGDYPKEHALVGYWARDEISVEKKRPTGYVEIIFDIA